MKSVEKDIATRAVADIMQRAVLTVSQDTPLSEVARLLWDKHVSGVPVVDPAGKPIGVVSAADFVRAKGYGARFPRPGIIGPELDEATAILKLLDDARDSDGAKATRKEPTAHDVMTPVTFTVRPATTVPELALLFERAGVHRALVMEHERLVGIVSTFDIVTELARSAEPEEEMEPVLHEGVDREC